MHEKPCKYYFKTICQLSLLSRRFWTLKYWPFQVFYIWRAEICQESGRSMGKIWRENRLFDCFLKINLDCFITSFYINNIGTFFVYCYNYNKIWPQSLNEKILPKRCLNPNAGLWHPTFINTIRLAVFKFVTFSKKWLINGMHCTNVQINLQEPHKNYLILLKKSQNEGLRSG